MTLANGLHYLAIPGPSVMPERVLRAMHRAAPNIYEGQLIEMTESLVPDLKAVARTSQNMAMYISNGHGAWEAALSNVLSRGDKVLVLATGRFGTGWGEMAAQLGAEVEVMDFGKQAPIDLARLAERLAEDKTHQIKAILSVQSDTSTGVKSDISAVGEVISATGHPALFMVDAICCLGCDRLEMDDWGVDVVVAGSQKGLMTPPGMSFVFFSEAADEVRETADCVTAYWDWRPRCNPDWYYQNFCGTAPTHHLYGLREALDMIIHEEGIEAVWRRHAVLARAIWAAADAWAADGPLRINVADPEVRSNAVTCFSVGAPNGTALRDWVTANAGITLGIGLGMAPPGHPEGHGYFRIGHMGHVNAQMVMGVLGAIDAGLKALAIPHGGVALEAATAVMAAGTKAR